MRMLVTGAAGLTGGAVVQRLAELGHDVTGVVRRAEQCSAAGTTVVADVADASAMRPLLESADACVHVAGILLGERLAEAIGNDRRLVVVSSAGIYSQHRASATSYDRHERALRSASTSCVVVRPTMIYGSTRDRNFHHVVAFARRYRFLPLIGHGGSLIQPIHYQDLAAALVHLVQGDATGVVDAGGGRPVTVREAAVSVFHTLGLPPRTVAVPPSPAVSLARLLDALRGSRWAERVERFEEDRSIDNTRLVSLTGRVPRELAAGLRDMVDAGA